MEGVILTKVKKIEHPLGNIFHAIKASENSFTSFGEAYFTTVLHGATKGWKKHTEMILNLVVPVGEVQFVMCRQNSRETTHEFFSVNLSPDNYFRLTIEPNIWVAFRGLGTGLNLVLNVASIEHSPSEAINVPLNEFNFNWDVKQC